MRHGRRCGAAVLATLTSAIVGLLGISLMSVLFPRESHIFQLLPVIACAPAAGAAVLRAIWPQAHVSVTKVVVASWLGVGATYCCWVLFVWKH